MTDIIVAALAGVVVGAVVGFLVRKLLGEKKIGSAEKEAERILQQAEKSAEEKHQEALAEKRETRAENDKLRQETEMEAKERRAELKRTEDRLTQKEEKLDKKSEVLDQKNAQMDVKLKEVDELKEQVEQEIVAQHAKLEELAGMTEEQAKAQMIAEMENEVRVDMSRRLSELEAEYRETAETKARNMITLAIQRCASDQVTEATITAVTLPNDDMKGRVIGREGRNIQKLETLTGVELIVDDTPETITISGFDPVRREVARLTLEKLITDGRIHPARIEEMVEKSKKEVEAAIRQAGEKATFDVNVHGLHPDVVKQLGRLRYRTSYGQNMLQHSMEVAWIAGLMAEELGIDSKMARRAGLLHDIGKSFPQDMEGTHVQLGVEFLKKYKENPDILHAVEAHHNDVEPKTLLAFLIQAADAVSAARPGARREDMENYIKRLQKMEEIANSFKGVDKSYAIQAGREIRVMVKPEVVNDETMVLLAREMAQKIESEMQYPGQIKINIIRETRVQDYAK